MFCPSKTTYLDNLALFPQIPIPLHDATFIFVVSSRRRSITKDSCQSLLRTTWQRASVAYMTLKESPDNSDQGEQSKNEGGGPISTWTPPTENSSRYILPSSPHIPFSLLKSPRNSQSFPQVTTSETGFRGTPTWFPTRHPREVLLFSTFCAPLYLCSAPWLVIGIGS